MAQMIPAAVPPRATSGEKALFKILAALPDDDFVYYDVQIKHRYADFVVISPRLGVLMIEIKDWKPDTIVSATTTQLSSVCSPTTKRYLIHSNRRDSMLSPSWTKSKHAWRDAYYFSRMDHTEAKLDFRFLILPVYREYQKAIFKRSTSQVFLT